MSQQPVFTVNRRAHFPRELDLSPFVRGCLRRMPKMDGLDVLDIPSGFGRHSLFLAAHGNRVVASDIDQHRLAQSLLSWQALKSPRGQLRTVVVDAERTLPFSPESFDLVLVIHYASAKIIEAVLPLIRTGGFLVYETFGAQGRNWTDLPIAGQTARNVTGYELLELRERPIPRAMADVVTVKLLAQRES